jgi:hypothetical protein
MMAKFKGVVLHLVDGGLCIHKHTNITIIFMEHDLRKFKNLKLILSTFEQLLGLKINFHKVVLSSFQGSRFYWHEDTEKIEISTC